MSNAIRKTPTGYVVHEIAEVATEEEALSLLETGAFQANPQTFEYIPIPAKQLDSPLKAAVCK